LQEKLIDPNLLAINITTGSSGSGNKPTDSSHHAERANVMRAYKPVGHRHVAEVIQELNLSKTPAYTVTATPLVRGISTTIHAQLIGNADDKIIRNAYRKYYADEPFIRIVKEVAGFHRLPEPKILTGSNFCDIGWELDYENRIVLISAIDNLVKGAAGQAVQAANVMLGIEETAGLRFPGLHPL
jgi:N-acetyl-gamma-glutamyl-phosphate/LysW-gamma-L-alpha-aminoadipyl-6-phosphate reductase